MTTEIERLLVSGGGVVARRDHPNLAYRLDGMARRGRLVTLLPGALVVPELVDDAATRIRAATQWAPLGTLTGRAAAMVSFWADLKGPMGCCGPAASLAGTPTPG